MSIGAHPGLPDLKGFGRRKMDISPTEVYNLIVYQLGALEGFCKVHQTRINHVKPHGALYNMGAKNKDIAKAIAKAVYDFDSAIVLVGLSNSLLISEAKAIGLKTASEVFADRRYEDNGQLVSRKEPDAVITDTDEALKQVLKMVTENKVISRNGKEIDLETDTICVHGDGKHALEFVEQIRKINERRALIFNPYKGFSNERSTKQVLKMVTENKVISRNGKKLIWKQIQYVFTVICCN